eukprot:13488037-Ditylum_brightwellii.AAC.1
MDGIQRPQVSSILASDVMVYSNGEDLVANTIIVALVEGGQAVLVSPLSGCFGVDDVPECCLHVGLDEEEEQDRLVQELEPT